MTPSEERMHTPVEETITKTHPVSVQASASWNVYQTVSVQASASWDVYQIITQPTVSTEELLQAFASLAKVYQQSIDPKQATAQLSKESSLLAQILKVVVPDDPASFWTMMSVIAMVMLAHFQPSIELPKELPPLINIVIQLEDLVPLASPELTPSPLPAATPTPLPEPIPALLSAVTQDERRPKHILPKQSKGNNQ